MQAMLSESGHGHGHGSAAQPAQAPPLLDLGTRLDKISAGMESLRHDMAAEMHSMASRLDDVERATGAAAQALGVSAPEGAGGVEQIPASAWRKQSSSSTS